MAVSLDIAFSAASVVGRNRAGFGSRGWSSPHDSGRAPQRTVETDPGDQCPVSSEICAYQAIRRYKSPRPTRKHRDGAPDRGRRNRGSGAAEAGLAQSLV